MKITTIATCAALVLSQALAFAPINVGTNKLTQRYMFGGSITGPEEEDPEKLKALEEGAKSMGMSVEEYQLGMRARERMAEKISSFRATAGTEVVVERDGNSPPVHLQVTISEEAKAKGKDFVQKEIVSALKEASDESKKGREEAQKEMMTFIGEEMKRVQQQ